VKSSTESTFILQLSWLPVPGSATQNNINPACVQKLGIRIPGLHVRQLALHRRQSVSGPPTCGCAMISQTRRLAPKPLAE